MAGEPQVEVPPDVGPLRGEDAVHDRVSHGAVAPRGMVPDDAVSLRAERLDRALRTKVEVVGPEADDSAPERVERVGEQEPLARRVDAGPLMALRIPRVSDLHAIDAGDDVVIARGADDDAGVRHVAHDPRQHLAVLLSLQRIANVSPHALGMGYAGEPQVPQPS